METGEGPQDELAREGSDDMTAFTEDRLLPLLQFIRRNMPVQKILKAAACLRNRRDGKTRSPKTAKGRKT